MGYTDESSMDNYIKETGRPDQMKCFRVSI